MLHDLPNLNLCFLNFDSQGGGGCSLATPFLPGVRMLTN